MHASCKHVFASGIVAVILAAGLAGAARGQDPKPESKSNASNQDYSAFRLILDRNIFNPDRRPPRPEGGPGERGPAPKPVDQAALLGVYIEDGRALAIFGGSKSEYNVTLKPGESISGYQVKDIHTSGITLTKDGQEYELTVGAGMRREEGGAWEIRKDIGYNRVSPSSENSSTSSASSSGSSSPPATAPSGLSREEILKQLMEKRRQEVGK